MEPSESENSLPPQEKPIASTKPTESLQSEQPASEERKALTEKPPHNQEPQNSTLTEKTKEPLVHSEIDNSQEKEKQAEISAKRLDNAKKGIEVAKDIVEIGLKIGGFLWPVVA